MAVRIPIYERTQVANSLGPAPHAEALQVVDGFGTGAEKMGAGLASVAAGEFAQQKAQEIADAKAAAAQKHQDDEDGKAWAGTASSNSQIQWMDDLNKRFETAKPGAPLVPQFVKDFDTYAEKSLESAPNPAAKKYLAQHLNQQRTHFAGQVMAYEADSLKQYRIDAYDTQTQNWATIVSRDPSQMKLAMDALGETGPSVGTKSKEYVDKARATVAAAYWEGRAAADPIGAKRDLEAGTFPAGVVSGKDGKPVSPKASFDTAIASLLAREGGYAPKDGKSGAPVNFGINQKANPDIDVARLTKGEAVDIYKNRYWKAIGGDSLPPATAIVALDTAALQGPGVANQLLRDTGGDPLAMIAKRRDQLQALAAKDPEHAKSLGVWMKRMDGLEKEVKAIPPAEDIRVSQPEGSTDQTGNAAIDALPYAMRVALIRKFDVAAAQKQTQVHAGFDRLVKDATASFMTAGTFPNPPTEQDFIRNYGHIDGADKYAEFNNAREVGQNIQRVTGMSVPEQTALLEREKPVPGPGFAVQQQRYEKMVHAVSNVNQMRAKDPANYVLQYAPDVRKGYEAMSAVLADPKADAATKRTAAETFAAATLAEQQRLGITKTQIMPDAYYDQQAAAFNNQAEGAQIPAQQLVAMAQQWGSYWPKVFGEFQTKLPPIAKVIGSLGADADPVTVELLARTGNLKKEKLQEGMLGTDTKEMSDKLVDHFRKFGASTAFQNGVVTFDTMYDGAEKLALVYMRQGAKPADAAAKAYDSLIGKFYNFNRYARIPKAFDDGLVMRGASRVVDELPADVEIPPAPAGMRPEDARTAYVSALKSGGLWLTAADGTGLILYDPVSNTPVRSKGQDVRRSWDDLQKLGAKPSSSKQSEFESNAGGAATGQRTVK